MDSKIITNIADYEENVLAGMTLRQVVLSVLGVAIVVGAYIATYGSLHMQVASYLAIGCGLPCFLFAFAKPQGKRLEVFIAIWLRFQYSNRKRIWQPENRLYDAIMRDDVKPIKHRRAKKDV